MDKMQIVQMAKEVLAEMVDLPDDEARENYLVGLIDGADLVFGVCWPDGLPGAYVLIIKGEQRVVTAIAEGTGLWCHTAAIPCVDLEMAVTLRAAMGDPEPYN